MQTFQILHKQCLLQCYNTNYHQTMCKLTPNQIFFGFLLFLLFIVVVNLFANNNFFETYHFFRAVV